MYLFLLIHFELFKPSYMSKLFLLFIFIFVAFQLNGQSRDTVELISTENLKTEHPDTMVPITQSERSMLNTLNYQIIQIDENTYGWKNQADKKIVCTGLVDIYKHEENNRLKAYCLVCIIDNMFSGANACIQFKSIK